MNKTDEKKTGKSKLDRLVRSAPVTPRRKVWVIHHIDSDRYSDQVIIDGVASTEHNRDMILGSCSDDGAIATEICLDTCCDPQLGFLISGTSPKW